MTPVCAVVLCGGTSRRFGGQDKTRAPFGDSTVLDTLLDSLPPPWPVTCVGVQRPTIRAVTWSREDPPLGGPVAGIAAGMRAGDPACPIVVVVAGDQPLAGAAADRAAQALERAGAQVDAVAAKAPDERPALLLCAYRRNALTAALAGDPRDRGVYATLSGLRIEVIDVPADQALDVDTPDDLRRTAVVDAATNGAGTVRP